jgi:hypothetical protein
VDSGRRVVARGQLPHALQIIVSAPISYLAARADDSHTNTGWVPRLQALVTHDIGSTPSLRFGLRPEDLTLLALVSGEELAEQLPLDGETVDGAVEWLRATLERHGADPSRLTTKKHYEIPAHRVATGAAFQRADGAAFAELARSYHAAFLVTSDVERAKDGASSPRCWPHHFDLATLIAVPSLGGGAQRAINVGLSPGDDSYAEPYFYVGPYPYPSVDALGQLALGRWHTDGWTGAVVTTSELGETDQRSQVTAFWQQAVAACERAFGVPATLP